MGSVLLLLPQDCFHSLVVFCFVLAEDENIVHMAQDSLEASEELAHPPLEVFGSARDAERELVEAEASNWRDERGQKA